MSHLKERKEKNCLNCQATLYGRYCHVCGQENLEPKETVWHLIQHFFNDITHFDGKFFSTVKYLVTEAGVPVDGVCGREAGELFEPDPDVCLHVGFFLHYPVFN